MPLILCALLIWLQAVVCGQTPVKPHWGSDLPSLRRAVEAQPENLGLRLRLAHALLKRDQSSAHPDEASARLKEARAQFAAILERNPISREPLRAEVIEAYTRGDHEKVIEAGLRLLEQVTVDADVTLWVLRAMVKLNQRERAAAFFVRWVGSGTVRSFGEVQGFMMVLVSDREQARYLEKALKTAIAADPQNINLLLYQAVFLAQVGRNVESWKAFHEAERLGLCGLSTGHRHAFARELLDRSMEPEEGPWSYGETGLDKLKANLAKAPEHGGLAMRIARVLDTSGKKDEALAYYSKASKTSPKLWSSVYRRAQILAGQKKFKEAIPLYRRVLEISPGFAAGELRLALALVKTGAIDEAIVIQVGFARRFSPERISRKILAALAEDAGALNKLSTALLGAIKKAPKVPYLHGHLALALHRAGETEQARTEALLAERTGLSGIKGHPHPVVFEVFEKPVKPDPENIR